MLTWILAAGALLCLIYFLIITLYAGLGAGYLIWLFFAAGLGAASWSLRYYGKYPDRIPLRLPVSLVTLCAAGAVILAVLQIVMLGSIPAIADSDLDYVIVLGCQVRNGEPGKILKLRLDKAAEYAAQNPDTTLILSGGQGWDEAVSEAQAMKTYLMEAGVPEERLILEDQSTNTVENIAFSRRLMLDPLIPPRVGILTSNFHLYRAKKIAFHQGMGNVSLIAAESDRILFIHYCFRDCLAILKDRIAGNL